MNTLIDLNTADGYAKFLRIKSLPIYRFTGREAWYPDEYAHMVEGGKRKRQARLLPPHQGLFDYQRDIAAMAVRKRRFAAFVEPGMGKTLIMAEWLLNAAESLPKRKRLLVVCPLMVARQTIAEIQRWYGDRLPIQHVRASDLGAWMTGSGTGRIAITNYEAITDGLPTQHDLGAIALDESSMLKSHYGKWGTRLIELGRGVDWKLCLTGTPAPNDRIEFANHAVFLGQFPTVNSFLAKFFVNRGMTGERWELKPHALRPFYTALSHWCIFLTNPAVYGWKDNTAPLPPIRTHIVDVALTRQQKDAVTSKTGELFAETFTSGGIGTRSRFARIAKGFADDGSPIDTAKPSVVMDLARGGTSLVWCKYNAEQDDLACRMPEAASIAGDTPEDDRLDRISAFQSGGVRCLITKPKILGFGLNLQQAERQVFSTIQDSYEEYYQAVKRSNRTGSTRPLDVFIPVTDLERPMLETVLAKADRVTADAAEQERLFKEIGYGA